MELINIMVLLIVLAIINYIEMMKLMDNLREWLKNRKNT